MNNVPMNDETSLLIHINQCHQRDAKGIAMKIDNRFVGAKILWGRPVKILDFPTIEAAREYARDTAS